MRVPCVFRAAINEDLVVIAKQRARIAALDEEIRRAKGLPGDISHAQLAAVPVSDNAMGAAGAQGGSGSSGAAVRAAAGVLQAPPPPLASAAGAAGSSRGGAPSQQQQQPSTAQSEQAGMWL